MSYLDPHHIDKIHKAYLNFENENTFSAIVDNEEILKDANARLSVQLFVKQVSKEEESFDVLLVQWEQGSQQLKIS